MNSQADDDIGFGIYTDIADLPMTGCPSYIEEGIGGVCEIRFHRRDNVLSFSFGVFF